MTSGFDLIAPAAVVWSIIPSDTTQRALETRAIWVGTGGNLVVEGYGPESNVLGPVLISNIQDGTLLPIRTKRVYQTDTTATGLVGLA